MTRWHEWRVLCDHLWCLSHWRSCSARCASFNERRRREDATANFSCLTLQRKEEQMRRMKFLLFPTNKFKHTSWFEMQFILSLPQLRSWWSRRNQWDKQFLLCHGDDDVALVSLYLLHVTFAREGSCLPSYWYTRSSRYVLDTSDITSLGSSKTFGQITVDIPDKRVLVLTGEPWFVKESSWLKEGSVTC